MKSPEHLKDYLRPGEDPGLTDARLAGELSKALSMQDAGVEGDWPKAEALIREAIQWNAVQPQDAASMNRLQARKVLEKTDFVVIKAAEDGQTMSAEWLGWRNHVRQIAETGQGAIPPEPARARCGAAPEPRRAAIPTELADMIRPAETPSESHARLTLLYTNAKQAAELARHPDRKGLFEGVSVTEWETKAERYNTGIRWNRGRMAETLG